MKKTNIFIKGIAIGAGMSIPGISGGTMAIILGIYNELLWRMGNIFKDPKKNIGFLCVFTLGGLGGIISSSGIISFILSTSAGVPLRFAFLGAAMGCIPPILRAAEIRPLTPKKILCILVGMTAATMLSMIPQGLFLAPSDNLTSFLLNTTGGFIAAVALVLPGISASQMLYMLGLYEQVIGNISTGNFIPLIPLAIGMMIGIFITAKVLSRLFRSSNSVYLVVLGFMIYSLKELIPNCINPAELIIGIICAIIGFMLSYIISSKDKYTENQNIEDITT